MNKTKDRYRNNKPMIFSLVAAIAAVVVVTAMFLMVIPLGSEMKASASSSAEPKSLRVAFYPLEGFFEYDDNGNEVGYGVEILNRISQYSGIQFTYVPCETWGETNEKLLNGEADVRMPSTYPMNRAPSLDYSEHSIIDTYDVLLTLKTRDDLSYGDVDNFDSLLVAIDTSTYKSYATTDTMKELNLTEKNLVIYDDYSDGREALESGQVDAIFTSIMDMDDELKTLIRFNPVSNYITMTIGNPDLEIIDNALEQALLEDPTYMVTLYKKWFPERSYTPLTKAEEQYLSDCGDIYFVFPQNEGYVSDLDKNGDYVGVSPLLVQRICDDLGIAYHPISAEEAEEGMTLVYPGFYYDYGFAQTRDVDITEPYMTFYYYEIQKKEEREEIKDKKIALIDGQKINDDISAKSHADLYDENSFLLTSNSYECIKAVSDGRADVTYVNSLSAEYYLKLYQYIGLDATLSKYTNRVCMAVHGNNSDILAQIINKTINNIPDEELDGIKAQCIGQGESQDIVLALIYRHPIGIILVAIGCVIVLCSLVFMISYTSYANSQNKKLLRATQAKSEFLSRVSHDIRTPLNAVLGFTQIAKEEPNLPEVVDDSLNKIESSGRYLLGLINDVLDMSKIESGKVEIRETVVDGPQFLDEIAAIFKAEAASKKITLITDFTQAQTKWVKLDKLRSRQIYSNLLNNAIKFSEPGGVINWTVVDRIIDDENMDMVCTIQDYGCGISEEFQKHMFEPFEREKDEYIDQREGTGLGLPIVKSLVQLMGGTIEVESELGKGTKFIIYLKRKVQTQPPESKADSINLRPISSLKGKRVLLCEDQELNIQIAVKILEKKEILVEVARNGQIGLDMLKASQLYYYDAILMDIRMPVMDGLTATRYIRALDRKDVSKLPIIAMTANAFTQQVEEADQAGIDAYLPKPVNPDLLYQTLLERIV